MKGMKSAVVVSSDEDESEVEKIAGEPAAREPPSRPRPRRVDRIHPDNPLEDGEQNVEHTEPNPTSPKPRPQPKAIYRVKSANTSPAKAPHESFAKSFSVSDSEINGLSTPKPSRKRTRTEEDEGEGQASLTDEGEVSFRPSGPQATPAGDILVRRKRVRH